MEVYILDGLLRRTAVVDAFESLIWTERFADIGDFELMIDSTRGNRSLFVPGVKLAHNESYRVMTVETVEDNLEEDGRKMLKVKGRSLEAILDDRLAVGAEQGYLLRTPWYLFGFPKELAELMFANICVAAAVHPSDEIPFVTLGQTLYPPDTTSDPDEQIELVQEMMSLLQAEKELCEVYNMGFRLYRNPNTNELYFNIYMGSDRTSRQTALPAVIFAPELDNLQNVNGMSTIEQTKNVCYVFLDSGEYVNVYQDVSGPEVTGFDRRVLSIKAPNPPEEVTNVTEYLIQKGKEELAKHRAFEAFDGEIDQRSQYKYQVDYNLGDLVEQRGLYGATNFMRVTEHIFVSDKEGEKSYPTLAIERYIEPGAWGSWNYNKAWSEFEDAEYWNTQG